MGNSLIPSKEFRIRTSEVNMDVFDHFSDEEIEKMKKWLEWSNNQTGNGRRYRWKERYRYKLLFQFLLETGARISEVLSLKHGDVSLEKNVITLRTLKQRNKEAKRTVPIHPGLREAYLNYVSGRELRNRIITDKKIFPMSRSAVDQFLKKMGRDLGFSIHAHKFRHTFAVKSLLNGVPVNILQQWLGHSNVWTTSTYTKAIGINSQEYMNQVKF